jgi:regulator of nonsense transcripts 2
VEFSVLDLFDALDSQLKKLYPEPKRKPQAKQAASKSPATSFIRYSSWIDAHRFVVAAEEDEVLSLARTRTRLLAQAGLLGSQGTSTGDLLEDDTVGSVEMSDEEEESINGDESVSSSNGDESVAEGSVEVEAKESDSEPDDDSEVDEGIVDDQDEIDDAAAEEAYLRQLQDEAFESELRK